MKKKIAFAMIMGIITTGIISFTLLSINMGFIPNFAVIWLKAWSTAYLVVIPVILLVGPSVQKLVEMLFAETETSTVEQ